MSERYLDKTVLVTGAASGIGRAIAFAAAGEGARLILGDIQRDRLADTAAELRAQAAAVYHAGCDISNTAEVTELVNRGLEEMGAIDVAFANAGVLGPPGNVWTYPEDELTKILDINVVGTWRTFRAVLPGMIGRRRGIIVATASAAGVVGSAGLAAYVASKHAVVGLVKSTAMNVAPYGIRVNAFCPHMVDTPMLDKVTKEIPGLRESLDQQTPLGRVATSDEVARSALWLGSDESSFVTGHPLLVDGGLVAQ
ncbi:SDR family NAD(P)-dependent oxidoreductase [Mycobacterium nebraskense]|uniref:Short-chain dehydrogenase n=1 Tax=Mycobacterium nebraskense TaxID=244292 RepID=A0A0F5NFD7_9MYCO|nr:SDR family NAD(P)-dependent oxidoreductase [Mycobacterium nebraskense]KKC05645.1 short-chain dehydrogenase [Mycobacterium nebraskense]KLO39752.1 short-chain dehydrogenase [Mycobacterium nebraskense]MBI2693592.1 SDR family oxidoreductase [Mycobacterium nebraskense]MCV7116908.1 SDR family oxidoreductase [Mycobacterium nebraskense]ORW24763.1 short-chain dehydrogenase [Mycobacterium nebraskense]